MRKVIPVGRVSGSSLIKGVGFEGEAGTTSTLRIRFHDTTLDFLKVPYKIFRGLVTSKDVSGYYFKHVHGKFQYQQI